MKVLIVVGSLRRAYRVRSVALYLLRSADVRVCTYAQHFEEIELGIERFPDVIITDGTVLRQSHKNPEAPHRMKFPDPKAFAKAKGITFIRMHLGVAGPLFLSRLIPLALRARMGDGLPCRE